MDSLSFTQRLSEFSIVRHPHDNGTLFEGDTKYTEDVITKNYSDTANICNVSKATRTFSSHAGTHADNPYHFNSSPSFKQYPDDQYQGAAIILDVSKHMDSEYEITKKILEEAMASLNIANQDSLSHILIRTNPKETYHTEPVDMFPYPTPEACRYIIGLGATVLGIDTPSIDHPHEKNIGESNHGLFYDSEVALLENLHLSPRQSMEGEIATIFDPTRQYPDSRGIAEIFFFPLIEGESVRSRWR